jgi:hypothetical protein
MPEHGRLRIHGKGEVEVELVAAYLADLKRAYDSILLFESIIDGLQRAGRDLRFRIALYPIGLAVGWPVARRRGLTYIRDWPPSPDEVASFVPPSEQLVLSGVRLSSPGAWDFLGKLNPLEVLRQYLKDRHERRKDNEYRESAEARRLELENLSLENRVISERIAVAKELGATNRDLAPLLNDLIYKRVTALGQFQDRGVITYAEVPDKRDEREG